MCATGSSEGAVRAEEDKRGRMTVRSTHTTLRVEPHLIRMFTKSWSQSTGRPVSPAEFEAGQDLLDWEFEVGLQKYASDGLGVSGFMCVPVTMPGEQ